jgi:geranylgeranyl pyrophosphate synthase
VVLLVDRTTRTEDLKSLLNSVWKTLPISSPNRQLAKPMLHLFHVEDSGKALRPLLTHLFAAAT